MGLVSMVRQLFFSFCMNFCPDFFFYIGFWATIRVHYVPNCIRTKEIDRIVIGTPSK